MGAARTNADQSYQSTFSTHTGVSSNHRTSLQMVGGFFDELGKFFGKKGNDGNAESDFDSTTCTFTIPAKSIKVGGLRLFLTLHFMGQQNTPTKGTWKCIQTNDGDLDVYYIDQTAAVSIEFDEDGIYIHRRGSSPSMQFVMQESVLLQGLLYELDHVVNAGDVKVSDRLLVLTDPGDAIEKARETLSFA